MAKALYGTSTLPSQLQLLEEIRSLRQRVADLEAALAEAEEAAADRVGTTSADIARVDDGFELVVDDATAGVGA